MTPGLTFFSSCRYIAFIICTVQIGAFVVAQTTSSPGTTKCRSCNNALSLEFCTSLVICGQQEECYMEEVVTPQLTFVYNGGCRALTECDGTGQVGKRANYVNKRDNLVSCFKCCHGHDCNANLCGVKLLNPTSTQCFACGMNHGSGVLHPDDCMSLTTCQGNEICSSESIVVGSSLIHTSGCMSLALCVATFKVYLETHIHSRRDIKICTACCAETGCNSRSCGQITKRMVDLYYAGKIDMHTLKVVNGTSG